MLSSICTTDPLKGETPRGRISWNEQNPGAQLWSCPSGHCRSIRRGGTAALTPSQPSPSNQPTILQSPTITHRNPQPSLTLKSDHARQIDKSVWQKGDLSKAGESRWFSVRPRSGGQIQVRRHNTTLETLRPARVSALGMRQGHFHKSDWQMKRTSSNCLEKRKCLGGPESRSLFTSNLQQLSPQPADYRL